MVFIDECSVKDSERPALAALFDYTNFTLMSMLVFLVAPLPHRLQTFSCLRMVNYQCFNIEPWSPL